jgi:hypothetical protein
MITKESKIKIAENILRQQVEEKPHLLMPGKEKQLFKEVKSKINFDFFDYMYTKNWISGYRTRKFPIIKK